MMIRKMKTIQDPVKMQGCAKFMPSSFPPSFPAWPLINTLMNTFAYRGRYLCKKFANYRLR